jgi:hypothetical protein
MCRAIYTGQASKRLWVGGQRGACAGFLFYRGPFIPGRAPARHLSPKLGEDWLEPGQVRTWGTGGRFGGSFFFLFGGVNKYQGHTFPKVAIYSPSPVFAHGQLYVALSRVGDRTNITMMITHTHSVRPATSLTHHTQCGL